MLRTGRITVEHIKKLDHTIDEIRLRALDNIIYKHEFGFVYDCDAVKTAVIQKLFNWFSFESAPQPERVLNFLLRLAQADDNSFLNAFGKLRFQKELDELKRKISPKWHAKLDEIEEAIFCTESETNQKSEMDSKKDINMSSEFNEYRTIRMLNQCKPRNDAGEKAARSELINENAASIVLQGGIRWLAMPWQPLVTSDKAVLAAVEKALNNIDTAVILHTCQFIMNVMMQDFPAEVFLQRPAIVMILHSLLESSINASNLNVACVIPTVLKTLRKLTRALRFRIYYYCEPCIANKEQKLLAEKLDSNAYAISEAGDGPDSVVPEVNYQAYQSAATSDRSQSINETVDDTALQSQQMLLPVYCTESLKYVLSQLSIPVDTTLPLRNVKYIIDLSHELARLLIISITPDIWYCEEETQIQNDLRMLFNLLGEMIQNFSSRSNVAYSRITYLHLVTVTVRLFSLVPVNIAHIAVPNLLQECIVQTEADVSINLLYPELHRMICSYAHQFYNYNDKLSLVKVIHQEVSCVIECLKNVVDSTSKHISEASLAETLKRLTALSKLPSYYEAVVLVKTALKYLCDNWKYFTNGDIDSAATDLTLALLNHEDVNVYRATYVGCHSLVNAILGIEHNTDKLSWENLMFLLKSKVLTLIICDGATSKDSKINKISRDILLLMLKGREQMGEAGWSKTIKAVIPVLHLLQCHADTDTSLGQCITSLFDPDVARSILLPSIELVKGNIRFLYSSNSDIRREAFDRLIWLLTYHKFSPSALQYSSRLYELSRSSVCILERKGIIKTIPTEYQKNDLKLLKMLKQKNTDPDLRKFILRQLKVILANASLHKQFLEEDGLSLILDMMNKVKRENNIDYTDMVIAIIGILKSVAFFNDTVREELSTNCNLLFNIVTSLFLHSDNSDMKSDCVQLLCLLAYSEHVQKCHVQLANSPNVSLPYIVLMSMKIPFECPYYLKPNIHASPEESCMFDDDNPGSNFIRLNLAWELHGGRNILWKCVDDLKIPAIINQAKVVISEEDLLPLQCTSVEYCCHKQLVYIQNGTTHNSVLCALDYLTMYLKLYEVLPHIVEDIDSLPWEETFKRYLLSHPTNKEDCDLFVDILNFLHLYLTVRKNGRCSWISKLVKDMTRSLADLFKNMEIDNQNVHEFIFKLVRTCSAIEEKSTDESKDTWILFVELVVSMQCFGDQQNFYNLAYLDWLLTCLTYLIGQCEWGNHKDLLISLYNTLIEFIISFHGAGAVSFMGLSITRNSIICLNHLLYQIQVNFNKNSCTWTVFRSEEGRSLSWLPMLWQNRDPLVRASSLQLLAGLINIVHTMSQLLTAIVMTPSDLCHTLLQYITNKEECCLVKEEACIALSNMLKTYNTTNLDCDDSLQPQTVLIYAEQHNIYHEIAVMCSNIYNLNTVDVRQPEHQEDSGETCKALGNVQEAARNYIYKNDQSFILPHVVWRLYYCQDESQPLSTVTSSDLTLLNNYITTPALITAICTLLNNLIFLGEHEVVRQIYEHSIDKYLFWCLDKVPEVTKSGKDLDNYCEKLEMYINICTVLTTVIKFSKEYTTVVLFSRDSLYVLFSFLDINLYHLTEPRTVYLRNRFWTEIYNFVASLSLMENQYFDAICGVLELCKPEKILGSILIAMEDSVMDLKISAISCLAFLLSLDIQNVTQENNDMFLRTALDTIVIRAAAAPSSSSSSESTCYTFEKIKLSEPKQNVQAYSSENDSSVSNKNEEGSENADEESSCKKQTIGRRLCELLLHLFTTYNYAISKKNSKQAEDKDIVTGTFANLLCVSKEAKRTAAQNNFSETIVMILKELYVKLNLQQPLHKRLKKEEEKKIAHLLHDVNCVFILLMNWMYGDVYVKKRLTNDGLADVVHKLWAWIIVNKTVLISALKMLATFTKKSNTASLSLTLTTVIPGSGLRKTPNTLALIHVIIQAICKKIERSDNLLDNDMIHYAFYILRNAVHVHECRVCISKSNLLQLFTTIYPTVTKKTKSRVSMETYFLEFLVDFTYYEEGQLCVPKATEALDALIYLASSSSIKVLAISVLRNIAFNEKNRSRLLSSVNFMNLLQDIFKSGSSCEIKLAGSILWCLVSNNQKGKLIARSAGFRQSIKEAVSTFIIQNDLNNKTTDLSVIKILLYVLSILDPDIKSGSNDKIDTWKFKK